jgi:hypothetical protein
MAKNSFFLTVLTRSLPPESSRRSNTSANRTRTSLDLEGCSYATIPNYATQSRRLNGIGAATAAAVIASIAARS